MKMLRSNYADRLASGVTTIAYCLRIVRRDGTTFRFTSHDRALKMQDTGAVYVPDQSSPDKTALRTSADGQAATFDLEVALVSNGIAREDILAGLFDGSALYAFRTLWDDPHDDDEPLVKGFFGQAELEDGSAVVEFRSLAAALDQEIGRVYTPTCDADLGDSRCQVRLTPPQWSGDTAYSVRDDGDAGSGSVVAPTTENGAHFQCVTAGTSGGNEPAWDTTIGATTSDGSVVWEAVRARTQTDAVTSVTSSGQFTGQLSGFPDDWWGGGTVRFTSGANAGVEKEVKGYVGGMYELWQAMPFEIAAGDTFVATAGCRKRFDEDCAAKFANYLNHQGFPHVPGANAVNKFGGQ